MFIIKIGGGKSLNWDYIARDLANLGEPYLLVHGANEFLDQHAAAIGFKMKTVTSPSGYSSRYSDSATMDLFLNVYCGSVNKRLVAKLQQHGINAVGLSGVDGGLWRAKRKTQIIGRLGDAPRETVIRDSLTGTVESVNADLIQLLLDGGYVPVISAPALSREFEIVNVDNDRAMAMIIGALGIKKGVSLFAAPGFLRDVTDAESRITEFQLDRIDEMMRYAVGGMKRKLLGVKEAFASGLEVMYWGDGRIENPLTAALNGQGTVIRNQPVTTEEVR